MVKSKDVFCKSLRMITAGLAGVNTPWTDNADVWLLEEDIEVIGYQMRMAPNLVAENDGYSIASAVLSQALKDFVGEMCHIICFELWNSVPASVRAHGLSEVVMFDPANTIKLKEGQQLYFGLGVDAIHRTAGLSVWEGGVIIFWRRR